MKLTYTASHWHKMADKEIMPTLHMAVEKAKQGIDCLQKSSKLFLDIGLLSKTEFEHIQDSTNGVNEQMEDLMNMAPTSAAKAVFNSPLQTSRKTPSYQNVPPTPASSPRRKLRPKKLTYPEPKKNIVGSKVEVWFVDPDIDHNVDQNKLTSEDLKSYSGQVIAVRKHNKRSHLIHYETGEKIWQNMRYLKRNGLISIEYD